ncbi:MAG: bifunctional diaminohydroxyphosphoribosylaminopyrimidine deaminase/5-amino-6-(5-phosphoribosylamino)uracil reductase RibD [Rikenellaceae bacterium]|jgi:diaminohydroxyphosphoribosylaminopyrimidine deaminase/5-amino-6-(5-phosphoribosylamino)uracil reductase|nr:bifunctional diaminohydroxyphosphoribosylaminopyrimidine deaminase/5-amino-6-(5-phosphoribosylamino)uracil reductase RibD [Rikenellaceae bacterium]
MDEKDYMRRCLELARNGAGRVAPNPLVGCVIVHRGRVIGEGFHEVHGGPHAEVNAIASVADPSLLRGSTLYVNLEPCSHWGKTPPCCDLILRVGIPHVVVGMADPFERVAGEGIFRMREAGIKVSVGILEDECLSLNRKFVTFHTHKRPYIVLKWAETRDGYLDNNRMSDTPPTWLTGPSCRLMVHRLRAESGGILVGTNTLLRDNPALTVRDCPGKSPLRVVVDRTLKLPSSLRVFDREAPTLILTDYALAEQAREKFAGIEVVGIDASGDVIGQMLAQLHQRGVQSLLVEGGGEVLHGFIGRGLWDEMQVFVSPLGVDELSGGRNEVPRGVHAPEPAGRIVEQFSVGGVRITMSFNDAGDHA